MANIVSAALNRNQASGSAKTIWSITFVNEKERSGTIEPLGDGLYILHRAGTPYYFAADKVVYMYPNPD